MKQAARLGIAEHEDRAADAAPARVMDVVADIAAALGARRGFGERALAEAIEQVGSAVIGLAVDDEECLIQQRLPPNLRWHALAARRLSSRRRERVNVADTIRRRATAMLARIGGSWQEARMTDRNGPQAGGFLLALCILVGALIGTVEREPSIGVIVGTAVGIVIAVALWLKDRMRTPL